MHIAHVSLIILLIIPVCAVSQERLPAEEILRWFPMDMYEEISHEETALIMASKHVEHLGRSARLVHVRSMFPFPKEVLDGAETLTHARITRVFVYEQTAEDGGRRRKPQSNRMVAMDFGDKAYAGEGVGQDLAVMRFLDPGAVIKKLVESGGIAEVGPGPRGLTVYSVRSKDMKGFEKIQLLIALETGEILSAESETMLARMLQAGAGEEATILGDPDYLSCEEVLGESGQIFTWGNFGYMRKAVLAYAEKQDAPAEDLANHKRIIDMPHHQLADGAIWDFSGTDVVYKEVAMYRDEEGALAAKKRWETGSIRMDQYSRSASSLAKLSVDDNKLIATTTFDKDTNKKLREAREERQRRMDEKKKAAEKKKEAGK